MNTLILILLLALALTLAISNWWCYSNFKKLSTVQTEQSTKQEEQSEMNKYLTQELARHEIILINLADVPFLTNELQPGYPKQWEGEVPYEINENFKGSTIRIKYNYTIDDINGKWIQISRK